MGDEISDLKKTLPDLKGASSVQAALKEAKEAVEGLGAIKEGVSKEEAEAAKEKIEAAGGTVELK